jgi:drug/metabolite transporter (DMT)-like permease
LGRLALHLRIAAPVLGPVILAELRAAFAALFLLIVAWTLRKPLDAGKHWKHFLILGLFNSALPFLLFSFAAKTLTASVMSILNATAPIWGAIIGAVWMRQSPSGRTMLGLLLGVAGVSLLVGGDQLTVQPGATTAIAAALMAAFFYGIATNYAKTATAAEPFANAHGSMWAAAILIAPATPFSPLIASPGAGVMAAAAALGIVCSGIAYLLYFRLIKDVGATSALTVTFLIPVFGVLWGSLFLSEAVRWNTIVGAGIIIVGTALVTNFNPLALMRKKAAWRA